MKQKKNQVSTSNKKLPNHIQIVVDGIDPRNRTYRERFQCLLQRIVFEAEICDVVRFEVVDILHPS